MPNEIIGKVSLSGTTELVFSIAQWRDGYFASVRKFVSTNKYEGPTKSGLTLDRRALLVLTDAATKLQSTIPAVEESEFTRIPKGAAEYIRITTLPPSTDEELPSIDIREYVDSHSYQGPTKRGIRFRWDKLAEVLYCLRQLQAALERSINDVPSLFSQETSHSRGNSRDEAGASERLQLEDVLGEPLKQFPNDFLDGVPCVTTEMTLPDASLTLTVDNLGNYILTCESEVFVSVRNPAEGNFLIYAQLRGHRVVTLPARMIDLFKCVKSYETYARSVRTKVMARLLKKTAQQSLATYETTRLLRGAGLPVPHE